MFIAFPKTFKCELLVLNAFGLVTPSPYENREEAGLGQEPPAAALAAGVARTADPATTSSTGRPAFCGFQHPEAEGHRKLSVGAIVGENLFSSSTSWKRKCQPI